MRRGDPTDLFTDSSHFQIASKPGCPSCSCHDQPSARTPSRSRFSSLLATLDACGSSKSLAIARNAHIDAMRDGLDTNIYIASKLIDAYAKCGSMVDARRVFDRIQTPNVVSWTALMLGYVETKQENEALKLFLCMLTDGCAPNARTFVALLKACAGLAAKEKNWSRVDDGSGGRTVVKVASLEKGMAFHSRARAEGFHTDLFVSNALVDMYSSCGGVDDAWGVFSGIRRKDVVSWNSIILGLAENRMEELALLYFAAMQCRDEDGCGCAHNGRTFTAALKACVGLAAAETGQLFAGKVVKVHSLEIAMAIHSRAAKVGLFASDAILRNGLLDTYAKCGSLDDAFLVFDAKNHRRHLVSWNSLIHGCTENGDAELALELFSEMKAEQHVKPDAFTFIAVLKACGCVSSREVCKFVHADIAKSGLETSAVVANSLVDVYGKCGSLVDAQLVFDSAEDTKDTVTWNSMLAGYSRKADAQTVGELFQQMIDEGVAAKEITFVHILSACSHAGDLDKCRGYLKLMSSRFGICPSSQHYNCLVDGLGRLNEGDSLVEMIEKWCRIVVGVER